MKVEISVGELVDKVTILQIKAEKVQDKSKLTNIRKEYDLLEKSLLNIGISDTSDEFRRLKEVNLRLWKIEDRIRQKEARQEFDQEFIQLARSVYFENDRRASIKKEINQKFDSELSEEKEYVDYK